MISTKLPENEDKEKTRTSTSISSKVYGKQKVEKNREKKGNKSTDGRTDKGSNIAVVHWKYYKCRTQEIHMTKKSDKFI